MKRIILAVLLSITLPTFTFANRDSIEVTYISGVKDTIEVSDATDVLLDKGDIRTSRYVYASYVRSYRDIGKSSMNSHDNLGFWMKWRFVLLGSGLILTLLAYFIVRDKARKTINADSETWIR